MMAMPIKTGLKSRAERYPLVSIVVPLRNDESYIGKCLQSLVDQTYPREKLEIIVVDGRSSDRSAEVVREYIREHNNIFLLDNPASITPIARNIGVRRAKGEFIAIIDSHNVLSDDYIAKALVIMGNRPDIGCVGGIRKTIGTGFLGGAIAAMFQSRFGVGGSTYTIGKREKLADTVQFPVYRQAVFSKIGLFDERLQRGQDNELNSRLINNRGKILFNPELVGYYYVRDTLPKLIKQAYNNGLWNIRGMRLVGWVFSARHIVPLVFVLSLLLSLLLALIGRQLPLTILISAYLSAATISSFAIGRKEDWRFVPILPILFLFVHISYGFGSLVGITEAFVGQGLMPPEEPGSMPLGNLKD